MSIAGGIILYTGAIDNAPTENMRDLIINVSASLLSIPLVFLLYDYTNSRVSNQMKKHLANSVSDRLNTVMLNLVVTLRSMLRARAKLSPENLNRMLIMRANEIARRLQITPHHISELRSIHNDIDILLYRNTSDNILTAEQHDILSGIARIITHLVNENKFRRNHHLSSKYTEILMSRILDWLDADTVTALKLTQHLTLSPSETSAQE